MNKFFYTFYFITLLTVSAIAQTPQHPWSAGLSINPKQYYGTLGSNLFKMNTGDFNIAPGVQFGRYINNYFDAGLHANFGRLMYNSADTNYRNGFNTSLSDIGLNLIMKLNNGEYIKEDALIQPYGIMGIGMGMYKSGFLLKTDSILSKGTFMNLSLGLGAKVRITDAINVGYQMTFNGNFKENYDLPAGAKTTNDGFMKQTISANYAFGKAVAGAPTAAEKMIDTDGDGVPDYKDKCPNSFPGKKVDKHGWPRALTPQEKELQLISDKVFFETNSDKLLPESLVELDKLVAYLNQRKWSRLMIEGHTDNVGEPAYNLTLSEKRTIAVKNYLISKGIDGNKLMAAGYGETKPTASNDTPEGKALNRRVEFTISK